MFGVFTIEVGLTSGYSTYLGKYFYQKLGSTTLPNVPFFPIATTGKYDFAPSWFVGLDLGYAIFSKKAASNGGVYYQPKIGYTPNNFELYFGYKGVSDGEINPSSVNLGLIYKLSISK